MSSKPKKASGRLSVTLSYQLLRNVTSPDETITGVKSFVANFPAFEILRSAPKKI